MVPQGRARSSACGTLSQEVSLHSSAGHRYNALPVLRKGQHGRLYRLSDVRIQKIRQFVIFLYNAVIHKSKAHKKFLVEMNKQIRVYHCITYTPELNPAKIMWRPFSKATRNRLYEDSEEIQKSM